jgi:hypothetical protein
MKYTCACLHESICLLLVAICTQERPWTLVLPQGQHKLTTNHKLTTGSPPTTSSPQAPAIQGHQEMRTRLLLPRSSILHPRHDAPRFSIYPQVCYFCPSTNIFTNLFTNDRSFHNMDLSRSISIYSTSALENTNALWLWLWLDNDADSFSNSITIPLLIGVSRLSTCLFPAFIPHWTPRLFNVPCFVSDHNDRKPIPVKLVVSRLEERLLSLNCESFSFTWLELGLHCMELNPNMVHCIASSCSSRLDSSYQDSSLFTFQLLTFARIQDQSNPSSSSKRARTLPRGLQ